MRHAQSIKIVVGAFLGFMLLLLNTRIEAQGVPGGGGPPGININVTSQPSLGSDAWTVNMSFETHPNDCDPLTEAFAEILPNGEGFCIDIDERPAQHWYIARNSCFQEGKRLPEIVEYTFACNQAASLGLNDMIGNREWGSNFSREPINAIRGIVIGEYGCNFIDTSPISSIEGGNFQPRAYRCVR